MEEDTDKIKCLYYIKDLRNDKIIYIGQTKDFQTRKYSHFGNKKTPIDKYMSEEGRENFEMNIFNNIDCTNMSDDEMLNKENELILQYDTIHFGLNKNRSGLLTYNKNYHKQYYSRNYHREYMKKYRETNKEREKERNRIYGKIFYQKHKEEILKYKKQYRQKT